MNSSNVLSFELFADDTTVYHRVDTLRVYVQNDPIGSAIEILITELAKVALWLDSNKLTVNVNSTQTVIDLNFQEIIKMLSQKQ